MIDRFNNRYSKQAAERFKKTLDFIDDKIDIADNILDLGPTNPLSELMKEKGHKVQNTNNNQDLDLDYEIVSSPEFSVVTAFEILEHLVSPFPLLKSIKANKLVASVPLRLWFSTAYWNPSDPFDRHYHEFEPRQFQMLLEKAGWKIISSEKWTDPVRKIGFRPILRSFTPRHYIVYCERM